MIELIILLGLAWVLKGWMETPTDDDVCDFIVMSEFEIENEDLS